MIDKYYNMLAEVTKDWLASDGGLTIAAMDTRMCGRLIQNAFDSGDKDALWHWTRDDDFWVSDTAITALKNCASPAYGFFMWDEEDDGAFVVEYWIGDDVDCRPRCRSYF